VKRFDSPYLPSFPSDKDCGATPSDKDASDFPPNGPIAIELRIERGFSVSGTQQTRALATSMIDRSRRLQYDQAEKKIK
jgi:hypothetical protein